MKAFKVSCYALVCCLALFCQQSQADGGRLWIYPYDWGTYWDVRPEYQNVPNPAEKESPGSESEPQSTSANGAISLTLKPLPTPEEPDPKEIITPREQEKVLGGNNAFIDKPTGGGSEPGYVNVPRQQAIIAWNGREDENGKETIILTTEEESIDGSCGCVLNIVPLPGPPISIALAENGTKFRESKELLFSKTPQPPQRFTPIIIGEKKKCPHNIFVWELDNVETFQRDVQAWIAKRFDNKAAALFTEDSVRVLQYYFERGFKYFAFDLTEVGTESTKQAIAYTFQSSHVYYPLVISRIGGSDDYSLVDLIIMTPGTIHLNGAITEVLREEEEITSDNQATLVRNGSVSFSIDEVESLDPSLNVFDSDTEEVTVRNIKFYQMLNGFTQDFTAVATLDEE